MVWFRQEKIIFYIIAIIGLTLISTASKADKLDGIDWTTLYVDGVNYEIPLYNEAFKNKIYYVKRAIEYRDESARDIVLGARDQVKIFIGDGEKMRWLIITPKSERVMEV